MLYTQKPKDIDNYIKVNSEMSSKLHKNGFYPKYFWDGFYYYEKTDAIVLYMKGGE